MRSSAVIPEDEFITPLLGPRREFITTTQKAGNKVTLCGLFTVGGTCDSSACTGLPNPFAYICSSSKACTNDLAHCKQAPSSNGPCPGEEECGRSCFDKKTQFCHSDGRVYDKDSYATCGREVYKRATEFFHSNQVYSKSSHSTCGGELYRKRSTIACCGSTLYNPTVEKCCGSSVIDPSVSGCCGRRVFDLDRSTCCGGSVVDIFDEGKFHCTSGTVCHVSQEAHFGECYVPGSASMGGSCLTSKHCQRGDCSRNICVCRDASDCLSEQYCKSSIQGNRCLADGTIRVGSSCETNRQCQSNKCQGNTCVCSTDSDCRSGFFCNKRLQANRCLRDGSLSLGNTCAKNRECRTGKCQGGSCVCGTDSDCSRSQYCNTRVGSANRCVVEKPLGTSCSRDAQCGTDCCKLFRLKKQCRPSSKCN